MFDILPINKYCDILKPFNVYEKRVANAYRTDLKETDDKYILEIEMPGFNKEDINIKVKNNIMTIKAEHDENKENNENERYIYSERIHKSYSKSYDVSEINSGEIKSSYTNGVLVIELPKNKELSDEVSINID